MADNPTLYNIGLDPGSVTRVVLWAAGQPDWTDDSDPFPAALSTGDITFIGAKMARTREQAVEDLLDIDGGEPDPDGGTAVARLGYVRAAALDGVAIEFVVSAASYVGVLPVELERKLKFG